MDPGTVQRISRPFEGACALAGWYAGLSDKWSFLGGGWWRAPWLDFLRVKALKCDRTSQGRSTMQAGILLVLYVLTTVAVQFLGFLISRLVDYQYPTLGLMTFLILFLSAFGIAWPIAVRITEWLLRRGGYVVQSEQSGGAGRLDHLPRRRPQ